MVGAFFVMLASFWAEELLVNMRKQQGLEAGGLMVLLPSVMYSAVVFIMNCYYRKVATWLTEWGK
jgi:anoctamin-10